MNITEKFRNGNDYTQIKRKIAYKVRSNVLAEIFAIETFY